MGQNELISQGIEENYPKKTHVAIDEQISPVNYILPVIIIALILVVLGNYTYFQKMNVIGNAEQVTNQMAEYIAENISNEIGYGESSIGLSAVTIAQTMTSDVLEKPAEVITPMVENTPFANIEYIRADGMNVMNIGEPFDASDRTYYIEGIKGNTGIWNNYHPKTSKETLINFYTPLVYNEKITGVITGYIEANTQIAPLFETKLYGQDIYGLVVDENNMVICSTFDSDYVPDLTLDMFMDRFNVTVEEKLKIQDVINNATEVAASYKEGKGAGRICVTTIPDTEWKVAIIVPAASFDAIVSENTKNSVIAIVVICILLFSYAGSVLYRNVIRRRKIAKENRMLEEENRVFNEENQRAFAEISAIRDIIASANMGTWRIELIENSEPRMFVDDTMRRLLGIDGQELTPEKTYNEWFSNIAEEAVQSVLDSVEKMENSEFDENTYLWMHPKKGKRYVRCGGTAQKVSGGYILSGYHYDVDEVVRKDQSQLERLQKALNDKNEYYATLGTLESIFYSMHVIDLIEDTVVEYNTRNEIKEIVNHKEGAILMMSEAMSTLTVDEYKADALAFTDLTTLSERMKNKKVIIKQLVGVNTGWFQAIFITMEADAEGRPTKVIYATRVIDDEKKQEEKLIKRSQTDELTGLLNRRAYDEAIYANNDMPKENDFVYVSLDVNGLKIVNDNMGHEAGDELIVGASQCMRDSLGAYGYLYRVGGDEFVAILFTDAEKTKEILADFDERIISWRGNLIDSLSISYGWIDKEEEPGLSVRQMAAIAEQRMYSSKSEHYRKSGVDRRGQKDAHKALCDLYTKILKINITEDTYQIVNMDVNEQTMEKGFADSISGWLRSFGETGQVHPDDLKEYYKFTDLEYMKEYFTGNKTSLHVFYRRKYGDDFKQVMMEIIPANDYSEESQSLFMYVKNLEK